LLTFAFDGFKSLLQNFGRIWIGSKFGNFGLGIGIFKHKKVSTANFFCVFE